MLDQDVLKSGLEDLLRSFGLTANEARAYLALLRAGRQTPGQLAPNARLSRGRVYQVLAELQRKGFVTESPGPGRAYRPVDPPSALAAVLEAQSVQAQKLADLAASLTPKLVELRHQEAGRIDSHPAIEVLARPEQIVPRFKQLEQQATSEVLLFTKKPFAVVHENVEEYDALSRGVRHACLYERELLDTPWFLEEVRTAVEHGEEARIIDRLPMKMAVFDRRLALLPLASVENPLAPFTLVVVHDAGLADSLALAFDRLWEQAEPIPPSGDARSGSGRADADSP